MWRHSRRNEVKLIISESPDANPYAEATGTEVDILMIQLKLKYYEEVSFRSVIGGMYGCHGKLQG